MRNTPRGLLDALIYLGIVPDGVGEYGPLTYSEAAVIRAAGWSAVHGRTWRAPIMPHDLVANTAYLHLSDALPRAYGHRPGEWRPFRSHLIGFHKDGSIAVRKFGTGDWLTPRCCDCQRRLIHALANADMHAHIDIAQVAYAEHAAHASTSPTRTRPN